MRLLQWRQTQVQPTDPLSASIRRVLKDPRQVSLDSALEGTAVGLLRLPATYELLGLFDLLLRHQASQRIAISSGFGIPATGRQRQPQVRHHEVLPNSVAAFV